MAKEDKENFSRFIFHTTLDTLNINERNIEQASQKALADDAKIRSNPYLYYGMIFLIILALIAFAALNLYILRK